jgi:hypothetical protein
MLSRCEISVSHKSQHNHPPSKVAKFNLEQLQQFGKLTWHLSNFGKTRKIGLQKFGKPTWQK